MTASGSFAIPGSRRRFFAPMAIAGAALLAPPAFAQFDAGQQANLMHQHELMRNQSTGDGPDWLEPKKGESAGLSPVQQAAIKSELQAMIERRRREFLPEYERRVAAEGKPAADAWLRQVATEAGRRDGAKIRAKYGQ